MCTATDCPRPVKTAGLCVRHYMARRRADAAKGLCSRHYDAQTRKRPEDKIAFAREILATYAPGASP
jgi:hypothetical protein